MFLSSTLTSSQSCCSQIAARCAISPSRWRCTKRARARSLRAFAPIATWLQARLSLASRTPATQRSQARKVLGSCLRCSRQLRSWRRGWRLAVIQRCWRWCGRVRWKPAHSCCSRGRQWRCLPQRRRSLQSAGVHRHRLLAHDLYPNGLAVCTYRRGCVCCKACS